MIREEVEKCAEVIKAGGVILYPTDTIWGLGCDPKNEEALLKINQIKKRQQDKNYILLVSEQRQLNFYIPEVPEVCYDLIDFSEKPITIIYSNARNVAPSLLRSDKTLGVRITKDDFCKKLSQKLRFGIVSTSANISGEPNPESFSDISEEIKKSVDYIVNLRQNEKMKIPSSIVKVGLSGDVKIIRK